MKEIFAAIKVYAEAYSALERLQRADDSPLPIGDQKTGVIAEFYARLYAKDHFSDATLIYGSPSEHAWDITVQRQCMPDHKIQVKAVSVHSETSRVSVIHPGWHELYLMRLNEHMWPEGFWVLSASLADWSSDRLEGSTMPRRGVRSSGSRSFASAVDRLDALLAVLGAANPTVDSALLPAALPLTKDRSS